jgi:hypothetical protein
MPAPSIAFGTTPGAKITAAVLGADMTAITSQTTLQNITGLGVPIGSSSTEIWLAKYWLFITGGNVTMDMKIGFSVPTSCTMKGGPIVGGANSPPGWSAVATTVTASGSNTESTVATFGTSAGNAGAIPLVMVIFGGGTAGTVQIQYAQNTSDGSGLTVKKGSLVEYYRLQA